MSWGEPARAEKVLRVYVPCSNKPSAVMSWLEHVEPEEPYILIIDTVR